MNITVYCGAKIGNNPAFASEAYALGAWMAREGHALVWGSGDTGLMGAVAEGVLENGGHAIGVIPRFLEDLETPFPTDFDGRLVKEFTDDLAVRRTRMIDLGDAFVALPGGPGTLDEISEVIGFAKLDMMNRPIILMNVNGFYDTLVAFIDNMVVHGFIPQRVRDAVLVASSAAEVAALLEKQGI